MMACYEYENLRTLKLYRVIDDQLYIYRVYPTLFSDEKRYKHIETTHFRTCADARHAAQEWANR